MKPRNYPEGYLHKIKYWNFQLQKALSENDLRYAETCMHKIYHFISSHVLTYPDRPESIEYQEKDAKLWNDYFEIRDKLPGKKL
jgi:hypothetical protein